MWKKYKLIGRRMGEWWPKLVRNVMRVSAFVFFFLHRPIKVRFQSWHSQKACELNEIYPEPCVGLHSHLTWQLFWYFSRSFVIVIVADISVTCQQVELGCIFSVLLRHLSDRSVQEVTLTNISCCNHSTQERFEMVFTSSKIIWRMYSKVLQFLNIIQHF